MRSIAELGDLTGRRALITGGAGHLGRASADALAEQGCQIVLLDINEDGLTEACTDLSSKHAHKAEYLRVDLEDEAAIGSVPQHIERFGGLDILINNAGFVGDTNLAGWTTTFAEQSTETFRRAMAVNVTAVFALSQACLPYLKASTNGNVINIASIYGLLGPDMGLYDGTSMGNPAAYAASKGGVLQFTRWLATVAAPEVRVNAISPGGIARNQTDAFVSRYEKKVPLGRMGEEEDIKGAVLYLASDLSRYVTGQNLIVDGGFSSW